jgi:manganese transport protein
MANEFAPPLVKTIDREPSEELRPDSPMLPSPNGMPETRDSWLKRAQHKVKQHKSYAWLSTFAKFVGPGYLIAVGYIDPGNWATDLSAGSQVHKTRQCI